MATPSLFTEAAIRKAETELSVQDTVIGGLIRSQKLLPRIQRGDYFAALTRSIVGQQISVKAAKAIYTRLEKATGLEPKKVKALAAKDIKTIGLSGQKSAYIRDLADHFIKDPNIFNHLERQEDEAIILELTSVKGIGRWTAQMFLMFTLGRPDVFPADDVGIQIAMAKQYGWYKLSNKSKSDLEKIAEAWKPYRTVACWHLWQSLDIKKQAIV
jgi:DNA-3-methyladenine glycosylase II